MEHVEFLRGELPDWAMRLNSNGYGYGYGDGYGHSNGYGYGYGYGDGYGHSNGHSNGYGYGYGYGDSYGYGSGYSCCNEVYWLGTIDYFVSKWPTAQQERLAELRRMGAMIAYWRSNADGTPANGGQSQPVYPGLVQREKGPLRDKCGVGQLHATLIPQIWDGERVWIVALLGEVRGDVEKYWALEREIIGECTTQ